MLYYKVLDKPHNNSNRIRNTPKMCKNIKKRQKYIVGTETKGHKRHNKTRTNMKPKLSVYTLDSMTTIIDIRLHFFLF